MFNTVAGAFSARYPADDWGHMEPGVGVELTVDGRAVQVFYPADCLGPPDGLVPVQPAEG